MRNTLMGVAALALASGSMAASTADQGRGAYASVNGLRMYYETYGPERGVPLVLLHGGGSTIDSTFGRIIPFLARDRRVIAVEEQAHGRTSDRDAPVRFETSADDVATLLEQLHVAQADVFGFSNGASIALQVALRHPQAVRKLVFASSFTNKAGAQPQLWEMIRSADFAGMPQGLKDAFLQVNPDPAKLRVMHDKDLERMRHFQDVPDAELRAMRVPTLILIGDRDVTRPEHAVELTHLIPGARLIVLVGGHGEYMGEATLPQRARAPELTAGLVADFLDGA
ncbi:MAG TPA: alpha/beta hydrolase [Steroidobacteraceae bacterium]|nr:alpha/beta hydrolase [Steroidobacteraceae bacterium]